MAQKGEDIVRKNVLRLLDAAKATGRSQREVALAAGIDPSRFTRFIKSKGGVTVDEQFGLAKAFDVPVRTIVRSPEDEKTEPRFIPTIYLRTYPARLAAAEAIDQMFRFRHRWEETHRDDPRAYAVDVEDAFEDMLPGDIGIFTDSQPPRLPPPPAPGRPQIPEVLIVMADGHAVFATYLEVDGKPGAQLPSGQVRTDFDYRGRRIELNRRT